MLPGILLIMRRMGNPVPMQYRNEEPSWALERKLRVFVFIHNP